MQEERLSRGRIHKAQQDKDRMEVEDIKPLPNGAIWRLETNSNHRTVDLFFFVVAVFFPIAVFLFLKLRSAHR